MAQHSSISRRHLLSAAGATAAFLTAPAISRAQAPAKKVRIGHVQGLTGIGGPYGIRARDGALLALEEIAAAGGVPLADGSRCALEIVHQDMSNDPRQAITLFRQFASDSDVVAVLGPTNSVGFVPLVPVAGQLKVPLIGTGSLAPIKEWNPWAYRPNPVSAVAMPAMMRKIVAAEKIRRLGVIYDIAQDAQRADAEIARKLGPDLGYEVVSYESFRSNDQDYSPQIAQLRRAGADAVFVAAATPDGIKAVRQMRDVGISQPFITGSGSFQDPVYWDGSGGNLEGCYTWLAQDFDAPDGALKAFLARYNEQYPQKATANSTYGYDAIMLIAEAIRRAGAATREKVQTALSDFTYTSPIGTRIVFKNPTEGDNQDPSVVTIRITGRGTFTTI